MSHTTQHYNYQGIIISYYDFDERTHSVPCKPEDIHIVFPPELNLPAIKQEIVEDINQ